MEQLHGHLFVAQPPIAFGQMHAPIAAGQVSALRLGLLPPEGGSGEILQQIEVHPPQLVHRAATRFGTILVEAQYMVHQFHTFAPPAGIRVYHIPDVLA